MKHLKSFILRFMLCFLLCGSLTIAKPYIFVEATSLNIKQTVWVNGSNVNVRAEPNTKSKSLGKVNTGTELGLYEERSDGWSCVNYDGSTAYIKSDFLSDEKVLPAVPKETTKKTNSGSKKSSKKSSTELSDTTSSVAASPSAEVGETVYITSSGKCYHKKSTCSNMKNPMATTLESAVASGRKACSKCY